MSILDNLKRVKKQLLQSKHPVAGYDVEIRQQYAIGYAMLVCVNGHPNEIAKDAFKKHIAKLDLPESFAKEAIQTALEGTEETVRAVLGTLRDPKLTYIFMLDLYCLAQQDHKMTDKEQELIVLFEELFELNYSEVQFIRGFRLAVLKQNTDVAVKVVQAAIEQEVIVPHDALAFFLEGFEHEERLLGMTIYSGEKRELHYKTLIKGNVIVASGAELNLNGMEVRFADGASLIVDGGVLKANGAKFTASLDANQTMLVVKNEAKLKLENAAFHGASIVRALEVADGDVELVGCTFERCYTEERGGAIYIASGERFIMQGCVIENCSTLGKGAVYIAGAEAAHMTGFNFIKRFKERDKKIEVTVEDCVFKSNIADFSAGVYAYSVSGKFVNNTFDHCKGRAGAAAFDMLDGHLVMQGNQFKNCLAPQGSAVVVLKNVAGVEVSVVGTFDSCDGQTVKLS
ncbi:MAG: right-handed parallel beta-helix repeat-containing protein [Solibacillus sp.]